MLIEEIRPSKTAQRVAMRRAAHQLIDNPKILDDPIAFRIIGKENALALRADPYKYETSRLSPYLRAFVAARSRYAEDELALGIRRGIGQCVILGAGLDTFAYRKPLPVMTLRVFEVDHPATQTWKRERLKDGDIILPENLTFAPIDLETRTLKDGLKDAGFDFHKCTFFSWLGVTEYLMPETIMDTLDFIASMPKGSGVVFDYMISPSLLTSAQRMRFDAIAKRVALAEEPWQAFFEPESLVKDLLTMGFELVIDKGPEEINEMYFKGREDGLRVGSLSHLMKAEV